MSDPNVPAQDSPDSTPTEALQLDDQQPIAQAPAAEPVRASGRSHTRTILEVVGGVVAAGLIVVAGVLGFALGHATGDGDGRWSMSDSDGRGPGGPDAGAPMGPPGQGFGQMGPQGQGQGFGHHEGYEGYEGHEGHEGYEGHEGHEGRGPGFGDGGQGMAPGDQSLPTPSQQG